MKPLPVIPAAPLEVNNSTDSSPSCWSKVSGVLVACATKIAPIVR